MFLSRNYFIPFQFGHCLFIFSCLIIIARSSGNILNRSGEKHPVLFLNLRGCILSFTTKHDVSCGVSCFIRTSNGLKEFLPLNY